jgi:hypothetical protein
MSFVSRRIPYTCTAPEPVLALPRRDLARRTFGICYLSELALLNGEGFTLQCLFHQTFVLFVHRLF